MNVYSFGAVCDRYQNLALVNEAGDWETMYKFNGTPIGAAWQPLRVEILYEKDVSEATYPERLSVIVCRCTYFESASSRSTAAHLGREW